MGMIMGVVVVHLLVRLLGSDGGGWSVDEVKARRAIPTLLLCSRVAGIHRRDTAPPAPPAWPRPGGRWLAPMERFPEAARSGQVKVVGAAVAPPGPCWLVDAPGYVDTVDLGTDRGAVRMVMMTCRA